MSSETTERGVAQAQAKIDRRTYSIPETAAILGVSRGSAYTAAANGELPVVRIGSRLLVPADRLEELLAGRMSPGP